MAHGEAASRGVSLLALAFGVYATIACNRVREVPQSRSATVTLELQVVGDPLAASAGSSFLVPVRLRNVGRTAQTLMFTSSCSFGVAIARPDGRELARPQTLCLSVIREPTLEPGEVLEGSVAYTMGEPGVVPLDVGAYRVTPILLSISGQEVSVRSARLQVRPAEAPGPAAGGGRR